MDWRGGKHLPRGVSKMGSNTRVAPGLHLKEGATSANDLPVIIKCSTRGQRWIHPTDSGGKNKKIRKERRRGFFCLSPRSAHCMADRGQVFFINSGTRQTVAAGIKKQKKKKE